jgi:hypothetical protein
MRRIWMVSSLGLILSFGLILPGVAFAQHRGGAGMGGPVVAVAPHAVSAVAPRVVARVPTATRPATTIVHRTRVAGTPTRNVSVASGLTNLPVFSTQNNVPGLGFDYPHLAAVNSRHVRNRRIFGQGVPVGFGGGFLITSPEIVVENPQAVEEAQQAAAEDSVGPNPIGVDSARESQRAYVSRPNPAPEPPIDTSEYVFVRRDGGLLFAVAYSWDNGTLRYVTRDGVRKTVTQDALDMTATQQFNEQRGLNFRVPA